MTATGEPTELRRTSATPVASGAVAEEARPESAASEAPWRRDATVLVLVFLASRVVLATVGVVYRAMAPGPVWRPGPLGVGPTFSRFPFLDVWGAWDSSWYLSIAQYGYQPGPLENHHANYAFFPLYPLLSRWVGWVVGSPYLGGLVVANAAFLVACVFLYRLVALDHDAKVARRTVMYLVAAPAAFLFSAMLTESLYLALAVMCFYFARTRRWWAVGLLGFLLALTRGNGFLVAAPLLWMYLAQRGFSWRKLRPDVLWLALLPAGIGVFMLFNRALTGDALGFMHIQVTSWHHRLQNPLAPLWRALSSGNLFSTFIGLYMIIVLALAVVFLRRFGVPYAMFVLISVLIPMAYGAPWGAMIRYTVVVFPFYVVAAGLTVSRPWLDRAIVVVGAWLQVCLMTQWAVNSLLIM